jgi:hypothetical protein
MSRGGVTTIRVEEELRNIAGALFGGLVGGGSGGTSMISIGVGMGGFQSPVIAALMWFGIAGAFYGLARTIFGSISGKREKELRDLADRLQAEVESVVAAQPGQVGASSARPLAAGDGGTTEGA